MNISSEVRGRHTVGDKTCGCRLSAYDTYLFYPQCLVSCPFIPERFKKTMLTKGRSSDLSSLPRVAFPFIEQWLHLLGDCPI